MTVRKGNSSFRLTVKSHTLTNPGPQSSPEGSSPSLQILAADVDAGDTLTYDASGLPTGLTISSTTGQISGSLDFTSAGSYPVTVTVTDGHIASPVEVTDSAMAPESKP